MIIYVQCMFIIMGKVHCNYLQNAEISWHPYRYFVFVHNVIEHCVVTTRNALLLNPWNIQILMK